MQLDRELNCDVILANLHTVNSIERVAAATTAVVGITLGSWRSNHDFIIVIVVALRRRRHRCLCRLASVICRSDVTLASLLLGVMTMWLLCRWQAVKARTLTWLLVATSARPCFVR